MANKSKSKNQAKVLKINFGKDVKISNIDIKDGIVIFFDQERQPIIPKDISIADAHVTEKGKIKISRQFWTDPKKIEINTKKISKKYDVILEVDTKYDRNSSYPDICAAQSVLNLWKDEERRYIDRHLLPVHIFFCLNGNPERFAVWDLIRRFMMSELYCPKISVGIITDTDLDDINKICNRTLPIWENNFLPKGFDIIYARETAENFLNSSIKVCDVYADKFWKEIVSEIQNDKIKIIQKGSIYFTHKSFSEEFKVYKGKGVVDPVTTQE